LHKKIIDMIKCLVFRLIRQSIIFLVLLNVISCQKDNVQESKNEKINTPLTERNLQGFCRTNNGKSLKEIPEDKVQRSGKNTVENQKIYKFPVAVTILFKDLKNRLPKWKVQQQIDILNREFNKGKIINTKLLPKEFVGKDANVGFQFRLESYRSKKISKDFLPAYETDSFDVINNSVHASSNDKNGKFVPFLNRGLDYYKPWNTINIYVVEGLTETYKPKTGLVEGIVAVTNIGVTPRENFIILDPKVFGLNPYKANPAFRQGKTLVHEMGHFFNLVHLYDFPEEGRISEDRDCIFTDYVWDTPNQNSPSSRWAIYPYSESLCTDNSRVNNYKSAMIMNHMAQTADPRRVMFTNGQRARMRNTLKGYRKRYAR